MLWDDFASPLAVQVGPFASGAAVVASKKVRNEIHGQDRKLIGFDMEAYGIVYACNNTMTGRPPLCLIVKAISDNGDEAKNNKDEALHQAYAAYTSACYLVKLIENEIADLGQI